MKPARDESFNPLAYGLRILNRMTVVFAAGPALFMFLLIGGLGQFDANEIAKVLVDVREPQLAQGIQNLYWLGVICSVLYLFVCRWLHAPTRDERTQQTTSLGKEK